MLCVGIDPGESWCGFAALRIEVGKRYTEVFAEARVYSVKRRGYVEMVDQLIHMIPADVRTRFIVEDYRARRVGHQYFSAANTVRMIGAIEYGVYQNELFTFSLVPPGRIDREIPALFGTAIDQYSTICWPDHTNDRWEHCLSAWRVLGRYLLAQGMSILPEFRKTQYRGQLQRHKWWLPIHEEGGDLIARAAHWSVKSH